MEDFSKDLEQCLHVLSQGGVILYPTDTVWGLGCDATNEEAVNAIIRLKGKKTGNGLIILLASEREVLKYVTQPDLEVFNYLEQRTKPTTVIYEGGTEVAEPVLAENGSIAIRVTNDLFCRHLVKRFRKPIVSTSANIHGSSTPQNYFEISNTIRQQVDYVVGYRQNELTLSAASSIIRWRSGNDPEILRP